MIAPVVMIVKVIQLKISSSSSRFNHALNHIENSEELSNLDILLFGHSWGGYAVSHVLNYEHDITGVVSIAGVNNPNDFISNKACRYARRNRILI